MGPIDYMAKFLVSINVDYLLTHRDAPKLADADVVLGTVVADTWCDIPACLHARRASPLDLACWKAAEMTFEGEKARVVFGPYDAIYVGAEDGRLIAAETLAPRLPTSK